jgi:hypothetical protein
VPVRTFSNVFKGTPSGRAKRPASGKALSLGAGSPERERVSEREARRWGQGWRGTRRWQAAAWPAASSAAAHRRGPLPPRGQPRTRPLAVPPSRTHGDRACKS